MWSLITTALSAIAALPKIIDAFRSIVGWLQDQFGPDWAKRIEELRDASEKWTKAQTTEERNAAVQAMARAFNSDA